MRRRAYDPHSLALRVASRAGDDSGNLETRANNLAELGPRDEFIHQDVASSRAVPEVRRLSACCVGNAPYRAKPFLKSLRALPKQRPSYTLAPTQHRKTPCSSSMPPPFKGTWSSGPRTTTRATARPTLGQLENIPTAPGPSSWPKWPAKRRATATSPAQSLGCPPWATLPYRPAPWPAPRPVLERSPASDRGPSQRSG